MTVEEMEHLTGMKMGQRVEWELDVVKSDGTRTTAKPTLEVTGFRVVDADVQVHLTQVVDGKLWGDGEWTESVIEEVQ